MFKIKRVSILAILPLILMFSIPAFAQENSSNPSQVNPMSDGYYYWGIEKVYSDYTTVKGSNWIFFYEGEPADRAGEVDHISCEVSVSHYFSGEIASGLKKEIEARLGYTFNNSIKLSATKYSAPLDVGEYVRGYYKPIHYKSRVLQRRYYRIDGYDTPTSETKTCYGYRANALSLKLEYYSSKNVLKATKYITIYP